ncbi:hypothetical protein J2T56_001900 [Natronobacillus azotifigens]|uniref:DUF4017 family protein n=1 Tax=Natronobacillus azotifigens TaxID=472978 RepID=A0A9J6RDL4_9BACI|nr:DUF4017 family protein [Natronobacillus azotifigens]MCZ0703639.1 DUF4017 family protein [Natronobacillus azotifigens]
MNKWLIASLVYILTCTVLQFISSSDPAYDTFVFKFILSQVYAIPLFLITVLVMCFVQKGSNEAEN